MVQGQTLRPKKQCSRPAAQRFAELMDALRRSCCPRGLPLASALDTYGDSRGPEGAGHFDGGLSAGHFDGPDTKGPDPKMQI